jgi:phosphoglycolate phosphatase
VNFFFDLDGTLTDPAVGITRSLQHALVAMGRQPPPTTALTRFIGPPLGRTFAELLATTDPALIAAAIAAYRDRFAIVGLYENSVYDGIPELLGALRAAGHRAWVVTSKPHVYARRIVAHFGLAGWFDGLFGSELSGENVDKRDLIRVALGETGLSPARVAMIGDRASDVDGARANGTVAVAVAWGYGSADELRASAPDHWVDTRTALQALVEGLDEDLSE